MADATDELLDVLDDGGMPTGSSKPRRAVHADGDWHRTFHLWLVREGNLVVVQRRSRSKTIEPRRLDVTVGGHFRAGETLLDVVREAEEEIGLVVRPGQLTYLGTTRAVRSYPDALDREFQEVYAYQDERPLTAYTLRCDEVETLYEVPIDAFIELVRAGRYVAVTGFDCQLRVSNALLIEDDLVPQGRELVARVLERLRDWLAGVDMSERAGQVIE